MAPREHDDSRDCWCTPVTLAVEPGGPGEVRLVPGAEGPDGWGYVIVHNDGAGAALGLDPIYLAEGTP